MYPSTLFSTLFTALLSVLFLLASVPDILQTNEAVVVFQHLGFPIYLLPFLGTAKVLGIAAVLAPRFRLLKEWAYAGLTFDLIGAMYSHISSGDPPSVWGFALAGLMLVIGSYVFFRKRRLAAALL